MDWNGQKLAESLCIYLTLGFGLVAFVVGYVRQDFGLMMKVNEVDGCFFDRGIDRVDCVSRGLLRGALCCCFASDLHASRSHTRSRSRDAIYDNNKYSERSKPAIRFLSLVSFD